MHFSFRHFIDILLLFIYSTTIALAQDSHDEARNPEFVAKGVSIFESDTSVSLEQPLRIVENKAFQVGEYLEFSIRYGPIVAGSSSMAVTELVNINGHPVLHIQTKAWSNTFFSKFFKVEDQADSYIDQRGIFSWKFIKKISEWQLQKRVIRNL